MLRALLVAAIAVATALLPSVALAADPVVTVPRDELQRSLTCSGPLEGAARTPVLLVHGTGSNVQESWRSGYLHALPREGFPACAVQLPERSMTDAQISAEYVVFAIREMAARSGRRVSVVGHSQGGLHPVWALRFWTELRGSVEDVVALAAPYQGTEGANMRCGTPCQPSVWQQRQGSRYLGALNRGALPAGPSFTSIASTADEVVYPQPEASRLAGARNILLQDICAGRAVDHLGILYDNLSYRLVLDALTNAGTADPARISPAVCQTVTLPIDLRTYATDSAAGAAGFAAALATAPTVPEEPALFCYADPSSARGAGTTCPRASRPGTAGGSGTGSGTRPRLRLRVAPGVVRAGRRVRVRFVVTARGRRVTRATVRVAGRSVRTGRRGRASLTLRFTRRGTVRVRASRPGFRPATVRLRVRPRGAPQPRFTG